MSNLRHLQSMPFHPFSGICVLLALAIPLFSSPLARSNIRPLPATSIADAVELVQVSRMLLVDASGGSQWSNSSLVLDTAMKLS